METLEEKTYGSDAEGLREAARDVVGRRPAETSEPADTAAPSSDEPPVTDSEDKGISVRDAADVRAEWKRQREEERRIFNGGDAPPVGDIPPVATDPLTGLPGDLDVNDPDALARFIESKQAELAALESEHAGSFETAEQLLEQRKALRAAQEKFSEAKEIVSAPEPPQLPTGRATRDFQMTEAAITQDWAARFPEIRSPEDLAALAQINPERASEAYNYLQAASPVYQARAQEAAVEQHQIAFTAEAEQHDKAFLEAHPELKDHTRKEATSREAIQYLTEHLGFSREVVAAGWANNIGPLAGIRSIQGQQLIYDASRQYAAAQARNKARPVHNVPAVQRPGVAMEPVAAREELVRALDKKLSNSHSIRDAARLLSAKRAARR